MRGGSNGGCWALLGHSPVPGTAHDGSGVQGRPAPPRPWACPFHWPQGGILRHLGGEGMRRKTSVRDWKAAFLSSFPLKPKNKTYVNRHTGHLHPCRHPAASSPTPAPVRGLWLGHTGPLGESRSLGRGGQVPAPGLQSVPLSKKGVPRRYYTQEGGPGRSRGVWLARDQPSLSLSGTSLSWEANWRAEGDSGPGSQACGLQQRRENQLGWGKVAWQTWGPWVPSRGVLASPP